MQMTYIFLVGIRMIFNRQSTSLPSLPGNGKKINHSVTEIMIFDWNENTDGTYPESMIKIHYVKLVILNSSDILVYASHNKSI